MEFKRAVGNLFGALPTSCYEDRPETIQNRGKDKKPLKDTKTEANWINTNRSEKPERSN